MNRTPLRISGQEVDAPKEDRFHRFRLIGWWDQERLAKARVLVIGAGALGNEIVKQLALLGVGHVLVADMDRIENSNLSRSVLYREADNGRRKAEAAAAAAKAIYPGMKAHFFNGNIVHELGAGVFRWANVTLGGLDNREGRLAINRHCWRVNRPWIDGAIESIQGCARVFVPDGPCYECTMSEQDWELLQKRRSCNLLSREEMEGGKIPTTPTISSIIAGVQCQEMVKLLHGMETMAGCGWYFQGLTADSYQVQYQRDEDCYSHDMLDDVASVDKGAATMSVRDALKLAQELLGPAAQLEFTRDMLEKFVCPECGAEEPAFTSLANVTAAQASCRDCEGIRREVVTFYKVRGDEPFLDQSLAEIGVPPYDVLIARADERTVGIELSGDAPEVLGPLAPAEEELDWL